MMDALGMLIRFTFQLQLADSKNAGTQPPKLFVDFL